MNIILILNEHKLLKIKKLTSKVNILAASVLPLFYFILFF